MRAKGTRLSANQAEEKDLSPFGLHPYAHSVFPHLPPIAEFLRGSGCTVYYGVSSPWFITRFAAVVNESDYSLLRKSKVTP